jgi:hypothetical protein
VSLEGAIFSGAVLGASGPRARKHCPQCWKDKPLRAFLSRGRITKNCSVCRARYTDWARLSPKERLARVRTHRQVRRLRSHRVTLVMRSVNRKTGPIPVTMTDEGSCPVSCPFRGAGCYASYGHVGGWWRKTPERGMPWDEFCAAISALPMGTLWRHNEAGDLPGLGDALDRLALARLVRANRGKRGFTFTHLLLKSAADASAVRRANAAGFTVNLSADSLEHADELAARGIGPVAVVLPEDAPLRATRTPAGRKVVVCPAQTHEITCADCRLCAIPTRKAVIGFLAHGQAKALVSELVRTRRPA